MNDEFNEEILVNEETKPKRGRNAVVKQKEVLDGEVITHFFETMTVAEYAEYSKANGRYMGRELGEKTVLTPEEFVVLSQDNWTPKQIMDKHGIDLVELQAVADRVPLIMQLKRRISVTDRLIKW